MPNRQISSLDRFVTTRAPLLAGFVDETRRVLALGFVAAVHGTVGLGSVAAAIASGLPAVALPGVFLLTSCGILAGVRAAIRRQLKGELLPHVRLTPEAQRLLGELIAHLTGWPLGRLHRRRRLRRAMRQGLLRSLQGRRSQDVLTPEAFQILESAAQEYNRIYGALVYDGQSRHPTLERLAPMIYVAADEAMGEILHTAALLDRFPESESLVQVQAVNRVKELGELAGQVERLQTVTESSPTLKESSSRIQQVLQELGATTQAQEELRLGLAPAEQATVSHTA